MPCSRANRHGRWRWPLLRVCDMHACSVCGCVSTCVCACGMPMTSLRVSGFKLFGESRVARLCHVQCPSGASLRWRLGFWCAPPMYHTTLNTYAACHRSECVCMPPARIPLPLPLPAPPPPLPLPSPSPSPNMRLKIGSTDAWPAVTTFAHNVQLPRGSPHSSASRSACAIPTCRTRSSGCKQRSRRRRSTVP